EEVIGLDASEAVPISAKTGLNIDAVLEAIVTRLPPPKGDETAPLKALLVDSWYDAYLGVVVLVRVLDGFIKKGLRIRMMGADAAYEVDRIGVFRPKMTETDQLGPGEVGYITAQIKQVADTRVATRSPTTSARRRRRCPASSRPSRWCSAASSRSTPPTSRTCAPRWEGSASTTRAFPTKWKPLPRSVSASAAASSASSTSRSSRSGSSASSTST